MELRRIDHMPDDEKIKMGIICRFENPFFKLKYDVANVLKGDTGGLSITWANLARRTRKNLPAKVCRLYLEQPNAALSQQVNDFVVYMEDIDSDIPETDTEIHRIIKGLGRDDEIWQACCDTIILQELIEAKLIYQDSLFYNNDAQTKTKKFMDDLGLWKKEDAWSSDIAHLICMDGIIHGGYHYVVYRLFDALRPKGQRRFEDYNQALQDHFECDPLEHLDPQLEEDFCEAYCVVRRKWLLNRAGDSNPALLKTTYRMDSILHLIENNTWDFEFGMEFSIFGSKVSLDERRLGY